MSLKVKCKKCNMNLDFDIRNPGLIVAGPCESCLQQQEEIVESNILALQPAYYAEPVEMNSAGTLQDRTIDSVKQDAGVDDGNDWEPVKGR